MNKVCKKEYPESQERHQSEIEANRHDTGANQHRREKRNRIRKEIENEEEKGVDEEKEEGVDEEKEEQEKEIEQEQEDTCLCHLDTFFLKQEEEKNKDLQSKLEDATKEIQLGKEELLKQLAANEKKNIQPEPVPLTDYKNYTKIRFEEDTFEKRYIIRKVRHEPM